jgi:hypothetical protein
MRMRLAVPVASATTAILLLGACSDDGPTTLAKGDDVNFVGGPPGLSDQTMDITAEEDDGKVTGEAKFDPIGIAVGLDCADTDTDDLVIVGGQVTSSTDTDTAVDSWLAVVIQVGDPDGVNVWFGEGDYGSCQEALEASKETLTDDGSFADVADGDDLETG